MPDQHLLELIAAQAAYLAKNAKWMWPEEISGATYNLKSLMEKL